MASIAGLMAREGDAAVAVDVVGESGVMGAGSEAVRWTTGRQDAETTRPRSSGR